MILFTEKCACCTRSGYFLDSSWSGLSCPDHRESCDPVPLRGRGGGDGGASAGGAARSSPASSPLEDAFSAPPSVFFAWTLGGSRLISRSAPSPAGGGSAARLLLLQDGGGAQRRRGPGGFKWRRGRHADLRGHGLSWKRHAPAPLTCSWSISWIHTQMTVTVTVSIWQIRCSAVQALVTFLYLLPLHLSSTGVVVNPQITISHLEQMGSII